ncbi:GAG-pre-integrase domain [Arabidopsis suecica]|uniref:GAG-pre-integrase domain n=1 Tax=Arabidopsis suecica TaxID=45249 RepID=A0A8T2CI81_ARASU|nr:GAG-pre-integrase domain [Arabidopsis suecica]
MGKRNCKSKYRSIAPDSPESGTAVSPRGHGETSEHRPSHPASGLANRTIGAPDRVDQRRSVSVPSHDPFEVSDSPDNIHSPYHLHNSDHPGLVLVSEPLDGNNYNVWVIAMTTSLEAKNKIGFLDGSIAKPDEYDPYHKIWCRCNSMVKSWLLNSVTKKIYSSILYIKHASDIWKDLHMRFHKSNLPRLYKLRHQLHSLHQGSLDLSSYHTQTQTLWEELSSIQLTPHTVEDLLAEKETNRVIDFLMGLNENYESIRSRILMKKTLPSLSEIYNLLDQEDNQRSVHLPVSTDITSAAFQVSQSSQGTDKSSQSSQGAGVSSFPRKDRPYCTFCGKVGHVVDRCYKKHGYPTSFKPNQRSEKPASSLVANVAIDESSPDLTNAVNDLSPAQVQQLMSFLTTKLQPPSSTPTPEVHSVSASSSIPSSSTIGPMSGTYHPSILCSFTGIDRPYVCSLDGNIPAISAWVIDTGATNHISHEQSSFLSFKPIQNTVNLPNGISVSIVGIGTIHLGRNLILHDVLYIPQFKFNLLSVSALTNSMGCRVWFDRISCEIQDPTQGLMIGTGRQVANLYFLDIESLSCQGTSLSVVAASVSSPELWHQRLGHPSMSKLQPMQSLLSLEKVKIDTNHHCKVCHLSKQKHLPFVSKKKISENPFDLVHIDTWGPFSVPTHDGFRYFLTIVDDCSRVTWVYLLKNKSDVLQVFPTYVNMVETQFQRKIKGVRSDNAPELNFTSFYQSKGIVPYHSCPETPQQNSVVERKHQHLLNVARSLFFQSQIPLPYWGDCILTAVHLINRTPAPILHDKSPFEVLTKKIPDYSELKVFGCLCYASTSPKNRHKFDPRARACAFLGYPNGYKGYKLLDIESNTIIVSRHVVFHEELFPFVGAELSQDSQFYFPDQSPSLPVDHQLSAEEPSASSSSVEIQPSVDPINGVPEPSVQTSHRKPKQPAYLQDYYCHSVGSSTIHEISKFLSYDKINPLYLSFLVSIDKEKEPSSYAEAKQILVWCGAMDNEVDALEETETWTICTLPPDKTPIGCKWVFKVKFNSDGSVERYKARLVAKGYTQKEGIDYNETFSPVVKLTTVKLVLALSAIYNFSLTQLDISNAFLNGDLDEEIYMKLPPGYADKEGISLPQNAVCKLQKSLYGLKQASRQWFLKFSSTLITLGFIASYADHTCFLKITDTLFLCVLVYVDDIIIASNNDSEVDILKTQLKSYFKLRDLGPLKYFLGLEIARSSEGIHICQRKYALDLLDETGLLGCKPSSIPMDPHVKFSKDTGGDLVDAESYRRLIGRLMYLQITRPDITFAVNKLSQYSQAPRKAHQQAIYKILHYIKGTLGQGLFYSSKSELQLQMFADADYDSCQDTRRSTSGFCLFLGTSLISWRSKKQPVVSKSSVEAEYRSLSSSTDELMWITHFLEELKVPLAKPTLLFCDNTAAIHIANNHVFHERTKHLEKDCHSVRERLVAGLFQLFHVRSGLQLADPFTKPLYPAPFHRLFGKMGLRNIFVPS